MEAGSEAKSEVQESHDLVESKRRKRIVSDGSRITIARERKHSDPTDSDAVELLNQIAIPFFYLHKNVTLFTLPISTPFPITC